MANHTANWTLYSSYHVYPHLAIYFGSPFGHYPTFHTLTSVERKKASQYGLNMVSLFRAVVKFCSTNITFHEFGSIQISLSDHCLVYCIRKLNGAVKKAIK